MARPNEPQKGNTPYSITLELLGNVEVSDQVSPFLLHMQHQSTTTSFHLLKLSRVKIFLNASVQIKKLNFVGTLR